MPPRAVEEVAPGVFVATSSRYTTTSTVVVQGGGAVLVDPAWTRPELDGLADWLGVHGLQVRAGIATHAHFDHLLWHPAFGDAPRWASATTVRCAEEWHDELAAQLGDDLPADWPDPLVGVRPLPSSAAEVIGESVDVVVHDGHAPGHTAVLFCDRGVLVAGDMLSDIELPLPFNPDDLPAYLVALDALAPLVNAAAVLVPGHGHVTDRPLERLDADRRYLDALLRGEDPDDPRRGLPGMAEAHDGVVRLARELRQAGWQAGQ